MLKQKRHIEFFIADILISIERILRYSKKISVPADFLKDDFTFSAIARELQIVGDAINHVLANSDTLPDQLIKKWRHVVNFRNMLVHEYFGINQTRVYDIVFVEVPILHDEVFALPKNVVDKSLLKIVLQDALADAVEYENSELSKSLEGLLKKLDS